ncbi:unnamed protein product [Pseudo-nitzschia multistriata]|uniref:Uncharacterized protein n=1 Tax=Pseudo-nitzschia multistriata TaxID=183589 RepID=A0A448Z6D5_9STRA|nr:unnamed protein product [Pseudo-nitzschia multistriata]
MYLPYRFVETLARTLYRPSSSAKKSYWSHSGQAATKRKNTAEHETEQVSKPGARTFEQEARQDSFGFRVLTTRTGPTDVAFAVVSIDADLVAGIRSVHAVVAVALVTVSLVGIAVVVGDTVLKGRPFRGRRSCRLRVVGRRSRLRGGLPGGFFVGGGRGILVAPVDADAAHVDVAIGEGYHDSVVIVQHVDGNPAPGDVVEVVETLALGSELLGFVRISTVEEFHFEFLRVFAGHAGRDVGVSLSIRATCLEFVGDGLSLFRVRDLAGSGLATDTIFGGLCIWFIEGGLSSFAISFHFVVLFNGIVVVQGVSDKRNISVGCLGLP